MGVRFCVRWILDNFLCLCNGNGGQKMENVCTHLLKTRRQHFTYKNWNYLGLNLTNISIYCRFFGIGFEYPWAIAYSLLPGIAYVERNWRNLQLILSVPPIIFLVAYYFIPESPRWLLSQGRIEEAKVILEKACKMNGRHWPENLVLEGKKKDKVENGASILDLFKTPNLRKNTLISYFNWFTASFVYYALTFDSGTLIPGNIYINFAVSGLIEIPAYTICIVLLVYLGRRNPLAFM